MHNKLRDRIAELDSGRFRTYCAIVIAMTAVLTLYSIVIVAQLNHDTQENNRRFNEYFNTAVDNNLNGISDFAYNILRGSFSTNMTADDSLATAAALRHEIYMYKNSNRLVGDIIEYFPVLNMLVGNNGYYSPFVYYKSGGDYGINIGCSQENFLNWFNCLFSDKSAGFYQLDDTNSRPSLFFFCSLPNPLNDINRREVVVILSTDGLIEILKELVIDGGYESALLADDNGVVYAHYGHAYGLTDGNMFDRASIDRDYAISESESSLMGLNCITIKEKGSAYKTVTLVSKILVAADIAALAVGIALAVIYAERNRRELYRLASLFKPVSDEKLSLSYIERQIDILLADNRSVVDEAEKQQRIVDTAFFRDILIRKNASVEEINLISTLYNEEIANDTFLITALSLTSSGAVPNTDIYAVISASESEDFRIFYTVFEDLVVFMLNFDSDAEAGRTKELIGNIKALLSRSACITASAVSMPFGSAVEIPSHWELVRSQLSRSVSVAEENILPGNSDRSPEEYVDPAILANEIAVKEFNNSQLSLQLLAERVGVSQAYLSRVFKQKYGMSVMHYINYLRVEEAKRLITAGDEPLKVIALKVGFISDINLIRVFKKYENITPGSYRIKENRVEHQ